MAGKRSSTGHRTLAQRRAHDKSYGSTPKQKENRNARKRARYRLEKEGKVSRGDGKDVGHKRALSKGGGNSRSNLKVQSRKSNRGHGTSPGGTKPRKK